MNHSELRQHFPHAEHELYVNHAATSPLSRPVMDAIDAYLGERHGARPGAPIDNFEAFMPILAEARERAGTVLGTTAERVAFMPNTSAALNVLAEGLDWQPGDRIALPGCEFPTNVYPFLNLEDRGVAVDFIRHDEGTFTLEAIEETLTPDTRLLSLSWVQFLSGFRADLDAVGALCDAHDVLFCVDAIQGLGALELDVEAAGIDFLACGGHKWLMATQGIGLLYCTEVLQDRIRPPAGWLHGPVDWEHLDEYELAFHPEARRYEIGTRNNVGIAALNAALGLYLDAGPAWCEQQVRARADQLAAGLRDLGFVRYGPSAPGHSAGIVTIRTEAPDALFDHLQAHDITAALRNRLVRFAPTYYNTPDEMERILAGVEAFATASSAAPN